MPLVQWCCEESLYRMQEAFRSLFRNFPAPLLAHFLRLSVFPTGLPCHMPGDRVDHRVARILLSESEVRDRLTAGIFITRNPGERIGQLERGLEQAERVFQTEGTLRGVLKSELLSGGTLEELLEQALSAGLLSAREIQDMEYMERLRQQVIRVDAFEPGDSAQGRVGNLEPPTPPASPYGVERPGQGGRL
ncbi:MAG: DUF1974 domain-containing protein [Gammaproteobacteria bacterium]|nr:DUF1974 domain-containing protein [Gammaproteobacteria bacterium]